MNTAEITTMTDQAFVIAHLLTGSAELAENATLDAIASWNGEESLLEQVAQSAARVQPAQKASKASGGYLPEELRAVLGLPAEPRRCYVLRFLVGLSSAHSARLLDLSSDEVDRRACAAAEALAEHGSARRAGFQARLRLCFAL